MAMDIEKLQKKIERIEAAIEKTHEAIEKRTALIDKKKKSIEKIKPNLDKRFMKIVFNFGFINGQWVTKKAEELTEEERKEQYDRILDLDLSLANDELEDSERKLKELIKKLKSQEAELKQVKEKNAGLQEIFNMVSKEVRDYIEDRVRSQYRFIKMDEDRKEKAIKLDTECICEGLSVRAYSVVGEIKSWKIIGLSDSYTNFELEAFGSDEKEYYAHLNTIIIDPYERIQYGQRVFVSAHYRNTTTRRSK